ncbi:effector-associated constant component EACC1 [Granulosicoccus sp. 3-233]|uniref:effector-associated constant component EACC1 n=1 Tax=Granulosicoccus sp. 3-233 TaxID=3417969 RepID=UPI003D32D7E1
MTGSKLQQESLQLERLLASQTELLVERLPEPMMEPGQRGAALELAKLIVKPLADEAAKALANVLGIYLQAKRQDTTIKMTGADGTTIEITGASLSAEELESTIRRIRALLDK